MGTELSTQSLGQPGLLCICTKSGIVAFMAIKKIPVPFCDSCDEPWLPKFRAADGTPNPIFENPELSKRCGKCKSTRWNAAGVDRRKKVVVESPTEIPQVTIDDVRATVCGLSENPSPELLEALAITAQAAVVHARCRHGLYSCPQCHSKETA